MEISLGFLAGKTEFGRKGLMPDDATYAPHSPSWM
jgi:hypothetical protein